jgi:drug/metabolite transporter (DMT)-like permease
MVAKVFLGHKHSSQQMAGVLCIVVGCVTLGFSNTQRGFAIADQFAPEPLFGNLMVVFGQLLIAVMFVYEEKVMQQYQIPVMQVSIKSR